MLFLCYTVLGAQGLLFPKNLSKLSRVHAEFELGLVRTVEEAVRNYIRRTGSEIML